MIRTFRCKQTKKLHERKPGKKFKSIEQAARRKLLLLNAAVVLDDLKTPPGNRLHALKNDRKGQHSIAINDQYRVCFVWRDGDAYDVEIVNYH